VVRRQAVNENLLLVCPWFALSVFCIIMILQEEILFGQTFQTLDKVIPNQRHTEVKANAHIRIQESIGHISSSLQKRLPSFFGRLFKTLAKFAKRLSPKKRSEGERKI
jgi:hypothetical protein